MRKILAVFVFISALILIKNDVQAQDNDPQKQVQTIRKNVYARVLTLTDAESVKFWPVFDEMQARLNEIKKKAKIERQNIVQNYNKMSDAQMEHALDNMISLDQEALDVKKKYYQKFKKVLPIKKVALLAKADREFKKELLAVYKGLKDAEE